MKVYTDVDIRNNELQNAVIQNLSEAPENSKAGKLYYDTTNKRLLWFNGTEWRGGSVEGIKFNDSELIIDSHGFIELLPVLQHYLAKSGDTMSGDIDMDGNSIINVANPVENADAANKGWVLDVVESLGTVLVYKGVVETFDELPISGNKNGDVWLVRENTAEYVYTDGYWEEFGPIIDLTPYLRIVDLANTTGNSTTTSMTQKAISDALNLKAPINNPSFTGTPTAPTPETGDSSNKLATTEFVTQLVEEHDIVIDSSLSNISENPVQNKIIAGALDTKVDKIDGKGLSTEDFTSEEKTKLAGIATGAEVNQNAFTKIKVGESTIEADGKEDTITLIAGANITATPNITNDSIILEAVDTKYNPATEETAGLMSARDKIKLNNIADSADNVNYVQRLAAGTRIGTITINGVDTAIYAPSNTTYTLTQSVTDGHKITLTSSEGVSTTIIIPDNDTTYTGQNPIRVNGTVIQHMNSGVLAGNRGDTANQRPSWGESFKSVSVNVDTMGHVTELAEHTVTIPDSVATTTNAGLMSASDKEKLNNIDSGATRIIVDNVLDGTSANPVQNKVIKEALDNKAGIVSPAFIGYPTVPNLSSTSAPEVVANKKYVDDSINSLGTLLEFKGTKNTVQDLPNVADAGDVWIVLADGGEYVWTGLQWERFGPVIDLSGYLEIADLLGTTGQSEITTMTQKAITDALALKAPLLSPYFSGTPKTTDLTNASDDAQVTNKKYVDAKSVADRAYTYDAIEAEKTRSNAYVDSAVLVEKTRAEQAENTLDTKIDNEIVALVDNAGTDYNTLGKLEDKIQEEVTRATTAEGAEQTRATIAEQTLQNNIDAEETRALGVEALLAPINSPAFTGTPTTPNLDSTSGGTQIANKTYVDTSMATTAEVTEEAEDVFGSYTPETDVSPYVSYTQDQTSRTTDAEKEVARKNIKAGSTNPNLLDNPWFTVNQRDFTSGNVHIVYFVDRWRGVRADITVSNNIVSFAYDESQYGYGFINQRLGLDSAYLTGRAVTLSFMLSDGTIYSTTFTPSQSSARTATIGPLNVAIQWNATYGYYIELRNYSTTVVSLKAVKLELGSYSTLANDAPPSYAEELAKCQRHFIRIKGQENTNYPIATGIASATNTCRFILPTPATLRTNPSAPVVNGSWQLWGNGTYSNISAWGSQPMVTAHGIFFGVTSASNLTINQTYQLVNSTAGGYIDFSADL